MKAFVYRLYPTKAQVTEMQRQLDVARELYNACLEERRGAWQRCGKSLNYYDQANQLKEIRQLRPDIASVNFSMLQAVCRRAQRSFDGFFRRTRAGQKAGYPRFKSRARWDSATFPSYGDGCKLTERLYLQGIGHIKIKLHRPVEGPIKTVTLKREGHRWFAVLACESPARPLPATGEEAGIDLGLAHFLTTDKGETVANPRHLYAAETGLRRSQRALARKQKGSKRRAKQRARLAEQHRRVRNARRDFHQKTARSLVNRFDAIYHEQLAVRNMVKHHRLARPISDASWGQFIAILMGKAAEAGRVCIAVNPAGTSQTCLCGERVEKTLRDRWHECPACGLSLPRDQISALLIKRLGHSRRAPRQRDAAHLAREAVCFS